MKKHWQQFYFWLLIWRRYIFRIFTRLVFLRNEILIRSLTVSGIYKFPIILWTTIFLGKSLTITRIYKIPIILWTIWPPKPRNNWDVEVSLYRYSETSPICRGAHGPRIITNSCIAGVQSSSYDAESQNRMVPHLEVLPRVAIATRLSTKWPCINIHRCRRLHSIAHSHVRCPKRDAGQHW